MKAELIFMGMKQQKFKMANSKIVNSANSQCFLQNFYGLILWQLNKFMQRTAIWLNLYGCHGVLCKVKKHKNCIIFACFKPICAKGPSIKDIRIFYGAGESQIPMFQDFGM
jgi:hypothetical protein